MNLIQKALLGQRIANSVYEFLAENNLSFSERYLDSLMTLRAYMILKFGAIPENPVLDIYLIINWFFDNLHISYEEALIKATDWREALAANNPEETQKKFDSELEDIRKLRLIKSRLGIIKQLSKSKDFLPNDELNIWISLWEKLP